MQKPAGKKKIPNSPRGSFVGVWVGFFSFLPLFPWPRVPACVERAYSSQHPKERKELFLRGGRGGGGGVEDYFIYGLVVIDGLCFVMDTGEKNKVSSLPFF